MNDFMQALRIFNKELSRRAETKGEPLKIKSSPTLHIVIGNEIRRRRLKMGINQTEASQVLRIGRTSITNIERGRQRCSIETLYLLAALFGCTVHDLLPIELPSDEETKEQ